MIARIVVHALLFQAGWLAAALLAAAGQGAAAAAGPLAVAAAALVLHADWRRTAGLAIAAGLAGLLAETALLHAGLLAHAAPGPIGGLAPLWIVALWIAFGTLPAGPLAWLDGRPRVAAALGAVLGPLAYIGGERLGAMALGEPRTGAVLAIAVVWGLAMPLLMALASRTRPVAPTPAA